MGAWLLICFLMLLLDGCNGNANTRKTTYVFIVGWAQSGTSMVHRVLSMHKHVGTMMGKCLARFGKKCENWNFEGQWMLPKRLSDQVLLSGQMCPIREFTAPDSQELREEWSTLWEPGKSTLVEKSPQSLVKIAALKNGFASNGTVKVIILTKHPVTLNVAIPRNRGWKHARSNGKDPRIAEKPLSVSQIAENFMFFSNFMSHNISDGQSSNCSLGWLEAHSYLHQYLASDMQWSKDNARVVRFEAFSDPVPTCMRMLSFIFDRPFKDGGFNKRFCEYYFVSAAPSASLASSTRASSRQLRLHVPEPGVGRAGFNFEGHLVVEEAQRRLRDFTHVLSQLPPLRQATIRALHSQVVKFGYRLDSLNPPNTPSLLAPWIL